MNEELIAQAEIGEQARKFVESDVGQCLIGMSHQEIQKAKDKLANVDPDDAKAIRNLQNDIKVATFFEQWLVELINNGNNAMQIFLHQREN
jgi:hypothetical protein